MISTLQEPTLFNKGRVSSNPSVQSRMETSNEASNGKTAHKSHLPVPEDKHKGGSKLDSKEKEQTKHSKTGKTTQKPPAVVSDDKQKTGRGKIGSKDKDPPRPLTRQGSKKELLDENARLKGEIHSHNERIKEMEMALKVELEKEERIKSEAENKENVQQGHLENITQKCEIAETKLSDFKNRILQSNVDPVTLSQIEISEENADSQFSKQTKAKEEVKTLREKLSSFRSMADEQQICLQAMEADLQEILGENCLTAHG